MDRPARGDDSGKRGLAVLPATASDPRLVPLRRAAASWRRAPGPRRMVIDQVCLVPDVPSFFEAIAAWDEGHYFPILIDEPAWTLPFLRAFRPALVVRYAAGRDGGASPAWRGRAPRSASDRLGSVAGRDRGRLARLVVAGPGRRRSLPGRCPAPGAGRDAAGPGPQLARQPHARRSRGAGRGPLPALDPPRARPVGARRLGRRAGAAV